jgi:hypothetical protein
VIFAPGEIALTTGAGVTNYFGSGVTGNVDVGAGWDARLMFGAHSIIALEAGYVGSVNNIDNPFEGSGFVSSQGVDGDLRLQLPFVVQPYVFGGVGYNHMAINNNPNGIPATNGNGVTTILTDDQFTVPAGAGLAGYVGKHVQLDLRGTYRYTPDNTLTNIMGNKNLNQWAATGRVGWVF